MPAIDRRRVRANTASRAHGMKKQDWWDFMFRQGGACAVCREKPPPGVTLQWDHDHSHCPGRAGCRECVRALVCPRCNTHIAIVENTLRFDAAPVLSYLEKWAMGRNEQLSLR